MKTTISYYLEGINEANANVYKKFLFLSRDPKCYSTAIEYPQIFERIRTPNQHFFAYVLGKEVLVVLVDQGYDDNFSELADEMVFRGEEPFWFSEHSHRASPVYVLNHAARAFPKDYKVTMMLLTSSDIINYDDWVDTTPYKFNLIVKHRYYINPELPTEAREGLTKSRECVAFYEANIPYLEIEGEDTTDEDDDLELTDDDFDLDMDDFDFPEDDEENPEEEDEEGENDSEEEDENDEEEEDDDDDEFDKHLNNLFEQMNDASSLEGEGDTAPESPYAVLGQAQREDRAPVRILPPLKNPHEELDKLVGMGNIRGMIEDMVALHSYNQRLYDHIKKSHKCSLHSIFSGAVGTGKTTMAQIMASLLHEAGVLSKGHCVVCNRATFIGRQWGTEEQRLVDVIERAAGGVLLVDEAYSLVSEHPHDPGRNVLNMLLDILADEKYRDIAIIFCGYTKQMERLLSYNPGLDSRFPNRFDFKDFNFDELMEITRRKLAVYGYRFTPTAKRKYSDTLRRLYDSRPSNWANGREVANLLERVYKMHSVRCMKSNLYGDDLLKIRTCDIPDVAAKPNNSRRVGF